MRLDENAELDASGVDGLRGPVAAEAASARAVGSAAGQSADSHADCYAGLWANHAITTPGSSGRPLITDVNETDIDAALDTASEIGDDIRRNLGSGRVDEPQFSHGSSAERGRWFTTGIRSGDPSR